jgi:hypothetical protein
MQQQRVPNPSTFGKAMQKQQHRAASFAAGAAAQGDAVGQVLLPGLDAW